MTTRYFKVTDPAMLAAMADLVDERQAAQKVADAFASAHGLTQAVFYLRGLYGQTLAGFKCSRSDHSKREDRDEWTIPKEGITRPKVKKSSPLYKAYNLMSKEVAVDGKELEELFGFNRLTYFPTSPGYTYKPRHNSMVFMMPESCDKVNGCVEITNVEYLQLENKHAKKEAPK